MCAFLANEKTKRQNFMTPAVHYEIIYKLTGKTNIGSKWCLLQKTVENEKKEKTQIIVKHAHTMCNS